MAITGVHALLFGDDAERARAFLSDVLDLPSVDTGGGWLIFALPPAELAVHPTDGETSHELFLMCDDIHATVAELEAKGVEFVEPISDQGWGIESRFAIPGGGTIGLYEPRHPGPPRPED